MASWSGPMSKAWRCSLRSRSQPAIKDASHTLEEGVKVFPPFLDFEVNEFLRNASQANPRGKGSPTILSRVLQIIKATTAGMEISIAAYTFDHSEVVVQLWAAASEREVKVRLLVDHKNTYHGRCKNQSKSMLVLMSEEGVSVRTYKPAKGGWNAALHMKMMVLKERVCVLGSANWTHNSHENCEEAALITRDKKVVTNAQLEFDVLWSQSEAMNLHALVAADEDAWAPQEGTAADSGVSQSSAAPHGSRAALATQGSAAVYETVCMMAESDLAARSEGPRRMPPAVKEPPPHLAVSKTAPKPPPVRRGVQAIEAYSHQEEVTKELKRDRREGKKKKKTEVSSQGSAATSQGGNATQAPPTSRQDQPLTQAVMLREQGRHRSQHLESIRQGWVESQLEITAAMQTQERRSKEKISHEVSRSSSDSQPAPLVAVDWWQRSTTGLSSETEEKTQD